MNLKELERLEKLAKEATPGPWQSIDTDNPVTHVVKDYEYKDGKHSAQWICECNMEEEGEFEEDELEANEANSTYIAAFNPATTLKLIASLKRDYDVLKGYAESAYDAEGVPIARAARQAVQDIEKEFGG